MLSVLSSIEVSSYNPTQLHPHTSDQSNTSSGTSTPNISTEVYPCLACSTVFGQLFSLKQRTSECT